MYTVTKQGLGSISYDFMQHGPDRIQLEQRNIVGREHTQAIFNMHITHTQILQAPLDFRLKPNTCFFSLFRLVLGLRRYKEPSSAVLCTYVHEVARGARTQNTHNTPAQYVQ